MKMIKSFTDLEQSRKLAEILPIESADCYWDYDEMQQFHRISWFEDGYNKESQLRFNKNNILAWSLAVLLDVLPVGTESNKQSDGSISYYYVAVYNNKKYFSTKRYVNLVDACVEMIIKLHEKKII